MRTIITILDGITETSMPFNEFVLYRAKHFQEEQHVLIVCNSPKPLPDVDIPSSLKIIYAGKKLARIRDVVSKEILKCKESNKEYLIHLHQVSSAMRVQIAMLGTGFRKKVLFTTHNTFSGYPFHNKVRSYFNGLLARYVTCVSISAYNGYPRSLIRLKGQRVLPVQNGVDTERIDLMLGDWKKEKDKETVTFTYVARMANIKNHDFLLEVAKEVNHNVRFLFIGSENPQIIQRIHDERLDDRIITTGLIPRNEVFRRLVQSDYYISSSVLEGLPVSILEGMYCGLPCVVSDIPQHKEITPTCDFQTLLPFDKEVWVSTINKLSQVPYEIRIGLGEKAKHFVKENFSLESMHKKYSELYNILSKE